MTLDSIQGRNQSQKKSIEEKKKYGTFKGVFTPSILTILGVIMFLRMGWVVGQVGLLGSLLIVTLSCAITFLTALSISATATNMKVGGGGAYYMISRSLGIEAGAAVGLPLYFAQSFGIAFYLSGFSESIHLLLPQFPLILISMGSLIFLTGLAYFSADFALKTQFLILSIIIAALVSFFMGGPPQNLPEQPQTMTSSSFGFWSVFAVFFPAVTGIEAGLAMSGDLKNPSKSLPWGTLAAVLVGFIIYLAIPIFLYQHVSAENLRKHPLIMQQVARWSQLILVGVWGASLSSALGALLGAPRTLQALARDRVVFRFLGIGTGKNDEPRIATAVTFIIALVAIYLGDLNSIAPVLSMFFLTSYGMLNFSTTFEALIANPSWRPDFKTPWTLSLVGAFGCFAAMFMINPGATIVSLILTFGVYYIMKKRKLTAYWGDMRRGILTYLAKYSMDRLARLPKNTKSWRPNVLVFSGAPSKRWYLIELGYAFASDSGFLTVSTILQSGSRVENRLQESENRISNYLSNRNIPAFVRLSISDDINQGIVSLVRAYGLGPIVPNTILIGETEDHEKYELFAEMIIRIYQAQRNCVLVRVPEEFLPKGKGDDACKEPEQFKNLNFYFAENKNKKIDVWWGRQKLNAGLGLALGFLLQKSQAWKGAGLCLKSITTDESEVQAGVELLQNLIDESRLDADSEMFLEKGSKKDVFERIKKESLQAGFVFIGMRAPDLEAFNTNRASAIKEYADYYRNLLEYTEGFPPIAFVLAAESLNFHRIFTH